MSPVRESNCQLCGYFCGLRVLVDDHEKITGIKSDPARYPYDRSVLCQCGRFGANREILDHPERLNHPLKRVGERGSGKWRQVTWEEAMGDIASRLQDLKGRYGAETLATCISAPHTIYWPMHRFLNLWGSPNNVGIGIVCWNPRIWVNSLTYGWPLEDELDPGATRCVLLWGINPAESDRSLFWKTLKDYAASGGRLIVIDPRRTKSARLTDRWLSVKPGADGALALGMLHVVIGEGLFDRGFVQHWCSGFDQLAHRVREYTPQKVSGITGICPSDIVEAAVLYASSKPAAIFTGLGIDMSGVHCTQTLRAIAALRAITGNVDVQGASFINERPDFAPEIDLELSDQLSEAQRAKKLGTGLFGLQRYEGYERLTQFTLRHGKRLPARYLTSAHPHLAWQAMITGEPYPIRALICMASNPLLCQADTKRVYRALKSLDLLVVLDQFLTPTAMLSDYVLPVTGSFEQPLMQTNGGVANMAYGGPAAVSPRYERRSDFDFWNDLGRRCGQEEFWPWNRLEEALAEVLAPAGMSWEDFCRTGFYAPEKEYRKWEKQGFATPSGKVELSSTILEEFGHDPLPARVSPTLGAGREFPLTLITGARKHPYYASQFRQLKRFRKLHPRPLAEISPATADRFAIQRGDVVWIETKQGRIRQEAAIAQMRDDVVSIEYGWWYPEKEPVEPSLGGLWESNANVLTTAETGLCDPILGQWDLRSIPCRIYKA
jgi:thiosulfate reductase/polysulfide reductase chain A